MKPHTRASFLAFLASACSSSPSVASLSSRSRFSATDDVSNVTDILARDKGVLVSTWSIVVGRIMEIVRNELNYKITGYNTRSGKQERNSKR
jgi:hypothetical protein